MPTRCSKPTAHNPLTNTQSFATSHSPTSPPRRGTRGDDVPPETQFLLMELGPDGPYAFIMPLIVGARSRHFN